MLHTRLVLWCSLVVVETVDKASDYMSRCQEQYYVTYQAGLVVQPSGG